MINKKTILKDRGLQFQFGTGHVAISLPPSFPLNYMQHDRKNLFRKT